MAFLQCQFGWCELGIAALLICAGSTRRRWRLQDSQLWRVNSAADTIFAPHCKKDLASRAGPAVGDVIDAMPYNLKDVGLRSDVKQTLIGLRGQNNGHFLSLNRGTDGRFGLLGALHDFAFNVQYALEYTALVSIADSSSRGCAN